MQMETAKMSTSFPRRRSKDNRICRFFISWRGCREGNECNFLHPLDAPRCKFFGTKRGCRSGHWCRYLHGSPGSGPPDAASSFFKKLDQALGPKTSKSIIEDCFLERVDETADDEDVEYHGTDRRSRGTQTDRQPEFIYCGECGEEFKYGRTVYQSLQRHYIDKLAGADYQHLRFFKCNSQLRRNDAYCTACGEWFRSVEGLLQHMGSRVAGISVSSLQVEHQNFFKKLTEPFVDRDLSLSGAEFDTIGIIRELYFVERDEVPVGEVEKEGATSKVKVAQKKEGTTDANNNEMKAVNIKCGECGQDFSEPNLYDNLQRHYMDQFGRACYDHISIFKRNKDLQGEVSCAACGRLFASAVGLLQHLGSKLDSLQPHSVESHRTIFWIITDPFVERDIGLITGKESVIVQPLLPILHRHLVDSPNKKPSTVVDYSVDYKESDDESLHMAEYFSKVNAHRAKMSKKEYDDDERERSLHEGFTKAEVDQLHSRGMEPHSPGAFETLNVLTSSGGDGDENTRTAKNHRRKNSKTSSWLRSPQARKDSLVLYESQSPGKQSTPQKKPLFPDTSINEADTEGEKKDDMGEARVRRNKKKRPRKRKGSKGDVSQTSADEVKEDGSSEPEKKQGSEVAEQNTTGQRSIDDTAVPTVKPKVGTSKPEPESPGKSKDRTGSPRKSDKPKSKDQKPAHAAAIKASKGDQPGQHMKAKKDDITEQSPKPKKGDRVKVTPKLKKGGQAEKPTEDNKGTKAAQGQQVKQSPKPGPATAELEKPKPKREKKGPRRGRRRSSTDGKTDKNNVTGSPGFEPSTSQSERNSPAITVTEPDASVACADPDSKSDEVRKSPDSETVSEPRPTDQTGTEGGESAQPEDSIKPNNEDDHTAGEVKADVIVDSQEEKIEASKATTLETIEEAHQSEKCVVFSVYGKFDSSNSERDPEDVVKDVKDKSHDDTTPAPSSMAAGVDLGTPECPPSASQTMQSAVESGDCQMTATNDDSAVAMKKEQTATKSDLAMPKEDDQAVAENPNESRSYADAVTKGPGCSDDGSSAHTKSGPHCQDSVKVTVADSLTKQASLTADGGEVPGESKSMSENACKQEEPPNPAKDGESTSNKKHSTPQEVTRPSVQTEPLVSTTESLEEVIPNQSMAKIDQVEDRKRKSDEEQTYGSVTNGGGSLKEEPTTDDDQKADAWTLVGKTKRRAKDRGVKSSADTTDQEVERSLGPCSSPDMDEEAQPTATCTQEEHVEILTEVKSQEEPGKADHQDTGGEEAACELA